MKSLEQELNNMHEINHSLVIVAAIIYNHEHDYESALRILRNDETLEGFVMINRKQKFAIFVCALLHIYNIICNLLTY